MALLSAKIREEGRQIEGRELPSRSRTSPPLPQISPEKKNPLSPLQSPSASIDPDKKRALMDTQVPPYSNGARSLLSQSRTPVEGTSTVPPTPLVPRSAPPQKAEPEDDEEARILEEKEWERREHAAMLEAERQNRLLERAAEEEEAAGEDDSSSLHLPNKEERVRLSSYAPLLLVATFKDIMDYTMVLAIPGIGTLISICVTLLLFLLLFFPKKRYRIAGNMRLAIIDALILLGLIPVEGLTFPFNLLPFTILAVLAIHNFDKKFVRARNEKRFDRKRMQKNLTLLAQVAWKERRNADKSRVSNQAQETWKVNEAA